MMHKGDCQNNSINILCFTSNMQLTHIHFVHLKIQLSNIFASSTKFTHKIHWFRGFLKDWFYKTRAINRSSEPLSKSSLIGNPIPLSPRGKLIERHN